MAENSSTPSTGSSPLLVFVYWAIVAVPLGWGVYKTVQKSIPLFTSTAPDPSKFSTGPVYVAPGTTTPAPTALTTPAAATPVPTPEATPFSSAQPSATVAPINAPTAAPGT